MKKNNKLSVWQILAIGYALVILVGSILLILPIATKNGEKTSYINALLTATSASCVTGLVTYDTATHWTLFGQITILALIQVGGIGFMTFVSVGVALIKKNMGLYQRTVFMQTAGESNLINFKPLLKRIIIGTFIFEFSGCLILLIRFIPDYSLKGIYYAVFISISAFCNAGFDVLGKSNAKFVSLAPYSKDPLVLLTVCLLILIGGVGFLVWNDISQSKFKFSKYQLHTKIVLITNLILVSVSTLLFLLFDYNQPALNGYNFSQKLLVAFFNSVTPRTAGFSIVDQCNLSEPSYILTLILMFIGGGSGSTAGGVKVTTIAVVIFGLVAVFKNKEDIEIGNKRIHHSLFVKAVAVITSYFTLIVLSVVLIALFEKGNTFANLKYITYDVVSALGTVGFSATVNGVTFTSLLSVGSKIVLTLLMFLGKAGILTIALAFGNRTNVSEIKKPIENVIIG